MCYTINVIDSFRGKMPFGAVPILRKGAQLLLREIYMAMKKSKQERTKAISCLGVLLIVCMLAIAVCTAAVNLMFKGGNVPKLGKHYFCLYTQDDMGSRIPAGSLVIAEEIKEIRNKSIVLYRNTSDQYSIAEISLVVDSASTETTAPATLYYLTTVKEPTAVAVSRGDIIGNCTHFSAEMGTLVGFLTGPGGIAAGIILPCLIMILYLCAAMVAAKEEAAQNGEGFDDDGDTDLSFVRSIQKKQQEIAERDAERHAREAGGAETDTLPVKHRMSDEELARQEEEEAERRAERIAAVRSHMEQRRQSDTPDGVPLYTTEIITKTHTLSIPKSPLTTTQQRSAVRTGITAAVTAELARAGAKTATGPIPVPAAHAKPAAPAPAPAEPAKPAAPAPAPAEPAKPAAPAPAPAEPVKPAAPAPAPAEEEFDSPIASASYEDLMAFLNSEEEKLK